MQVEVIEVTDKGIHSHPVTLHVGAGALEAIEAAGLVLGENDAISLWGRKVKTDATLSEGDRVEFARALVCDPKKVRQEHALAQGDIRVVTAGRHGGRRCVTQPKDGE